MKESGTTKQTVLFSYTDSHTMHYTRAQTCSLSILSFSSQPRANIRRETFTWTRVSEVQYVRVFYHRDVTADTFTDCCNCKGDHDDSHVSNILWMYVRTKGRVCPHAFLSTSAIQQPQPLGNVDEIQAMRRLPALRKNSLIKSSEIRTVLWSDLCTVEL